MHTISELLDSLKIEYEVNNKLYTLKNTNKYLKTRSITEQNYYYENDKNFYKREHYQFKNKGLQLIYIDDYMLEKPILADFTIPFIKFITSSDKIKVLYGRNVNCIEATNEADKRLIRTFIDKYHLQGNVGAKYYYGFYYNNTLVGAMSFGKNLNPKYKNDTHLIELKRMVWLPNYQIRYGLSKGIKHLLADHSEYNKVLSYSLNDISNGNSYYKSGFEYLGKSSISPIYINPNNRNDAYSFQINSPWGFQSGVVQKRLHKFENTTKDFRDFVIEYRLPHRTDDGFGYVPCINAGNDAWLYTC